MVFLGKILKSRGNRGEVVVELSPAVDMGEGSFPGGVLLKSLKHSSRKEIESIRAISGQTVVKFKDVDSIDSALRLIGYSLYGEAECFAEAAESPARLIGYQVLDDRGAVWGTVTGVAQQPMNPLLEIGGVRGGEPVLVPFHPAIIEEIRSEDKVIVIHPPEGLKDLNP